MSDVSPVGTAEGHSADRRNPTFSRAYGTDRAQGGFPSNKLLG